MATTESKGYPNPPPYVRVHPDWEQSVEYRLKAPSEATAPLPVTSSVAGAPLETVQLQGLLGPIEAKVGVRKHPQKFWMSAYRYGSDDDIHEDIEVVSAQRLETGATPSGSGVDPEARLACTTRTSSSEAETTYLSAEITHPRRMFVRCRESPLGAFSVWLQAPEKALHSIVSPAAAAPALSTAPSARGPIGPDERYWPAIHSMAVSPDGKQLAAGSDNGRLVVWRLGDGEGELAASLQDKNNPQASCRGHAGDVTAVRFFPSNVVLLSGGADALIKVWSVPDQACVQTLRGHARGITALQMIGRGRHVLSSSRDGTVKLWDCAQPSPLASYGSEASNGAVHDCLLLEHSLPAAPSASSLPEAVNGYVVATANDDGALRVFDLRCPGQSPSLRLQVLFSSASLTRLAYAGNAVIVAGDEQGFISAWDLRRNESPLWSLRKNDAQITALHCFGSAALLMASGEGDVTLWGTAGAAPRILLEFTGLDCEVVTGLAVGPSPVAAGVSYLYASGGSPGAVYVYDLTHDTPRDLRRYVLTAAGPAATGPMPMEM